MRKLRSVLYAIVPLLLSYSASAIELKPTPIQDRLDGQKYLASSDEFKDTPVKGKKQADQSMTAGQDHKPSMLKAAALSAVLPGLGEHYLGHNTKAKYFFAAEALTWVGYFSFHTYAGWKKADAIDYAAQYANADLNGRDDAFIDLVGFYTDIDQYNTLGRVSDPERPYLVDTPQNHWRWQTEAEQIAFRDIKNRSREAYRRSNFMLGVAVVNRIVSVIDAIRDARAERGTFDADFSQSDKPTLHFNVNPMSYNRQVSLTLLTSF